MSLVTLVQEALDKYNGFKEDAFRTTLADYGLKLPDDKDEITRRCVVYRDFTGNLTPIDSLAIDGVRVVQVTMTKGDPVSSLQAVATRLDK